MLDPSTEYSNGIMVLQNVYETLTRYNPETGEVDPMLATEWTKNEDGTVWTFQLRHDVTSHDGSQMTATQVVNSTGAGDAATAAIVLAGIRGMSLRDTALLAQKAGAVTCRSESANAPELANILD